MYRGAFRRVRRLPHRLRHRRMRVNSLHQLFDRALQPQCEHCFGDELRRAKSDDVHAQDLVVLLIGDDLDEAVSLPAMRARPRALNGNDPTRTSYPFSFACASVNPTLPISGSQYVQRGTWS